MNSLAVQWLGLGGFTALGPGFSTNQGTKIPQAVLHGQNQPNKKEQKQKKLTYNHKCFASAH